MSFSGSNMRIWLHAVPLHNMARRGAKFGLSFFGKTPCRKRAFWINSLTSSVLGLGLKLGNWFHSPLGLSSPPGWTWHPQCWTTAPVSPRYWLCTLVCVSLSAPLPVWLPWKGQPTGGHLRYPCLKDDRFTWLSTNSSSDHTKVSNSWSPSNRETPTNPATPLWLHFSPEVTCGWLWATFDGSKTAIIWLLDFATGTVEGTSPMVSQLFIYIYIFACVCVYCGYSVW